MVRILACIALFVFLVPVSVLQIQKTHPQSSDSQVIEFEPIEFHESDPDQVRIGYLTFLGGWQLTSDNGKFGGISAIRATGADSFVAIGDNGMLFGFTLPRQDASESPRGFIAPLPGSAGQEFENVMRDAESWAYDADTGKTWVGFEDRNGIVRYSPSFAREEKAVAPEVMQNWPSNGGSEAMLKMPDGRFIVFSEEAFGPDNSKEAFIFSGDPVENGTTTTRFGYVPPQGYKVTDAAFLPDGQVILVNRRFTLLEGVSAVITIADPADIAAGKAWRGEEIARLKPPYAVDNIEAVTVTEEEGKTIIWLASDDNFQPFQRSLLMKFRLDLG